MRTIGEISCPCCSGPLRPSVLVCDACNVRVEGRFAANEFASLPAEDLHLLRIFVRYEGRIRDMESALGLSYPTIKLRLAELRRKLALAPETVETAGSVDADAAAPQPPPAPATASGSQPLTTAPAPDAAAREQERGREGEGNSVEAILAALEAKQMSFQDAMRRLQQRQQR